MGRVWQRHEKEEEMKIVSTISYNNCIEDTRTTD